MTPASSSRRLALLAAMASSLLLAACGGGGGDGNGNTTLRAINLTTDLPSLDLYAGDTRRFSALATDSIATAVTLEANTYTLEVKRAGAAAPLLTGSYTLAKDKNYTAIIWGRETALRVSTLPEDENVDEITSTTAGRVRFFNATTDTGAVDVFLTPTDSTGDLGDVQPVRAALTSGSLSGFSDQGAANYRLRVTGSGDPNDVRLDIPSITIPAKKFVTLVITAGAGGVLVNGTMIEQRAGVTTLKNTKARMRVVASVGAAGNVSASLGGSTVVGALRSPGVGPYTLVNSGTQELVVRANGTVFSTSSRVIAPGADYTLLAYGAETAPTVSLLTDDNRLPSINTRAKIRLVNGLALTEALTMQVDYLTQTATSDIAAGTASAYATVTAAGSARLDITSPTAVDPLFTLTAATSSNLLQAQGVYTVFMLGGQTAPAGRLSRDR
ncbi:hypothetical protein IP87_15395 [beta proteobacterium AAP121]|nr:hypothetical protein IP80_05655 [beta proteobacterium AAP65]KPF95919.1 hypothetical protein IP87_15395 [beta proteobacterium AAP121]